MQTYNGLEAATCHVLSSRSIRCIKTWRWQWLRSTQINKLTSSNRNTYACQPKKKHARWFKIKSIHRRKYSQEASHTWQFRGKSSNLLILEMSSLQPGIVSYSTSTAANVSREAGIWCSHDMNARQQTHQNKEIRIVKNSSWNTHNSSKHLHDWVPAPRACSEHLCAPRIIP